MQNKKKEKAPRKRQTPFQLRARNAADGIASSNQPLKP